MEVGSGLRTMEVMFLPYLRRIKDMAVSDARRYQSGCLLYPRGRPGTVGVMLLD